ncbi:MAG TPA: NAD-dependent epimerase/dehydratase family protein [Phycisphaerae bacterium]|nr:NAD-dependent epimerase/dehydratase family protein [Phycisphaerae bacterium]HDZ43207.1 NAD-dependent epimerase/dehydratase family protein [Phycisphaerae bacterium]
MDKHNILITGGAGFIGSHLADRLVADGHGVVLVDDLSTGSLDNIADLLKHPSVEFIRESVRNEMTMTSLVDRCDMIYHLAAAVGVQLIVDRPVHTIETNIHGSEVMLNLANKFRRKILVASTSEVYGKNTKVPFVEDDDVTLGPTHFTRWSYACSKMVDEFLALAYHDQYRLPTVICRFFNTVGPRQTGQYGMVVPRFVRRALRGEPIEIYGTGKQSRCFCNVSDVVGAIVKLMACDAAEGKVVNVGTDESVTIEELANKIIDMTGSKSDTRRLSYEEAYGRPFDDMLTRVPSLEKVNRLIGYKPTVTLEETLRQVIDFERARM